MGHYKGKAATERLPQAEATPPRGPRGGLGLSAVLGTKLFPSEVERFKEAAAGQGLSPTELLRRIVRQAGKPLYYIAHSDSTTPDGEPIISLVPNGHICCQPPLKEPGRQCRYGHALDSRPRDRCLVCHRQREALRRRGARI